MMVSERTDETLRVGCVPYLNGRPLSAWLRQPEAAGLAWVVEAVPSVLAGELRAGNLDVALISVVEALTNPGMRVVPGISIAADGPVRSVRLLSKVPFGRIRTLALDSSSLTSAALCRLLLAEMYGVGPQCVSRYPDLTQMLTENDAALVIGDRALLAPPAEFDLDLGDAWRRTTGLPFVYAAWMFRDECPAGRIVELLQRARDWGVPRREALAADWSAATGTPEALARDYLVDVMQYDLDARKQEAVARFAESAAAHGLLERRAPTWPVLRF